MSENPQEERMISIWTWVGLVLSVYGVLIAGMGVYYIWNPHQTVLAELNPSLWWGAIMLVAGIVFLLIPKLVPGD